MFYGLNIAFFGSSLVSAYGNGVATYYRGIVRALAGRGHRIIFYEPDLYGRQRRRDLPDPDWARVVVYPGEGKDGVIRALARASSADLVIKASGVGVFDEWLERAVIELRQPGMMVAFWDVDAPATLSRLERNPDDPFRELIPRYDVIFTRGGGDPVVKAYRRLGARECAPICNALDPTTHYPVAPDPRFEAADRHGGSPAGAGRTHLRAAGRAGRIAAQGEMRRRLQIRLTGAILRQRAQRGDEFFCPPCWARSSC